jgi:hypothetical protein
MKTYEYKGKLYTFDSPVLKEAFYRVEKYYKDEALAWYLSDKWGQHFTKEEKHRRFSLVFANAELIGKGEALLCLSDKLKIDKQLENILAEKRKMLPTN